MIKYLCTKEFERDIFEVDSKFIGRIKIAKGDALDVDESGAIMKDGVMITHCATTFAMEHFRLIDYQEYTDKTYLFRGKRVDTDVWAYGDLIHGDDGVYIREKASGERCEYLVYGDTVGQYIGDIGEDKAHAIPAFEKDVIASQDRGLSWKDEEQNWVYVSSVSNALWVKSNGRDLERPIWISEEMGGFIERPGDEWRKCKVIGNAIDNPEYSRYIGMPGYSWNP